MRRMKKLALKIYDTTPSLNEGKSASSLLLLRLVYVLIMEVCSQFTRRGRAKFWLVSGKRRRLERTELRGSSKSAIRLVMRGNTVAMVPLRTRISVSALLITSYHFCAQISRLKPRIGLVCMNKIISSTVRPMRTHKR